MSLGALCWLPSVMHWAGQVASLLRPGGRLYLHAVHPLAWALGDDDLCIEHSCFEEIEPHIDDTGLTYTEGETRLAHPQSYEWNHSIGEIVSAVLHHGLSVVSLTEHDWPSSRGSPGWSRPPTTGGTYRAIDHGCRSRSRCSRPSPTDKAGPVLQLAILTT